MDKLTAMAKNVWIPLDVCKLTIFQQVAFNLSSAEILTIQQGEY